MKVTKSFHTHADNSKTSFELTADILRGGNEKASISVQASQELDLYMAARRSAALIAIEAEAAVTNFDAEIAKLLDGKEEIAACELIGRTGIGDVFVKVDSHGFVSSAEDVVARLESATIDPATRVVILSRRS